MEEAEFARTFNTGLGMVLAVAQEMADAAIQELENAGEKVWIVGKLVERTGEGCVVEHMELWR
jgi:phosphoribosylaminoimidazole (AIR) synthetase